MRLSQITKTFSILTLSFGLLTASSLSFATDPSPLYENLANEPDIVSTPLSVSYSFNELSVNGDATEL